MKIGIVQPLVGHIGGNDMVLDSLFKVFKDHQIELFTFTKVNKKLPMNVNVHTKIQTNLPFLGIYQKFLMPQHDYSRCDVIISTTGYPVKTDKPLIIYDQNNLANDFTKTVPLKYQKGIWKLYYQPYKFFNKVRKVKNAKYISNSEYCSRQLFKASGIHSTIIYPSVEMEKPRQQEKTQQICVIGRISPEKNLEQTIRILNQVQYPCYIFGNVTSTNQTYLKKIQGQAKSHIRFIINKPRHQLKELLAESKIIFSSSTETFGIAIVEGIINNCVPIVPNNSANQEVVNLVGCRFDNDSEAVEMINLFMDSENELKREILTDHVRDYSFENFEKNFLNSIDGLMK